MLVVGFEGLQEAVVDANLDSEILGLGEHFFALGLALNPFWFLVEGLAHVGFGVNYVRLLDKVHLCLEIACCVSQSALFVMISSRIQDSFKVALF